MSQFKFSVGPWNVHTGADSYGPETRQPVDLETKFARFAELGFSAIQFHDDDAVPNMNNMTEEEIKAYAREVKKLLDKYGLKAVFFSRMLPVVRTFISLPAGFAHVDMKRFLILTFAGALPWTALILYAGMMLGESWKVLTQIGHEASIVFVVVAAIVIGALYIRHKKRKNAQESVDAE